MRKNIIFFMLVLLGSSSCSSFLEPSSQTEFVPKTATSLNEMLLGEAYPRSVDGQAVFAMLPLRFCRNCQREQCDEFYRLSRVVFVATGHVRHDG